MSRAHIPDGSSSFRTPLPIRCSMFGRQALLPDSLEGTRRFTRKTHPLSLFQLDAVAT
jgi:hypothetical protein